MALSKWGYGGISFAEDGLLAGEVTLRYAERTRLQAPFGGAMRSDYWNAREYDILVVDAEWPVRSTLVPPICVDEMPAKVLNNPRKSGLWILLVPVRDESLELLDRLVWVGPEAVPEKLGQRDLRGLLVERRSRGNARTVREHRAADAAVRGEPVGRTTGLTQSEFNERVATIFDLYSPMEGEMAAIWRTPPDRSIPLDRAGIR